MSRQDGVDTLKDLLTSQHPLLVGDSIVYAFAYDSLGALQRGVRYRVGRPLDTLDVPQDLNAALSTYALSPNARHIAYVRFGGDGRGTGVVRTWPAGRIVTETPSVTVPVGDALSGAADWEDTLRYALFVDVFGDVSGRWLRFRGAVGGKTIAIDTVQSPPPTP